MSRIFVVYYEYFLWALMFTEYLLKNSSCEVTFFLCLPQVFNSHERGHHHHTCDQVDC